MMITATLTAKLTQTQMRDSQRIFTTRFNLIVSNCVAAPITELLFGSIDSRIRM